MPAIYQNCPHTQYAALAQRHIIDRSYIKFQPTVFVQRCREVFKKLRAVEVGNPYPMEAIVNGYVGGKKAVYERAMEEVKLRGWSKMWKRVRMFVKPDKIQAGEILDKAPRAIQFRTPQYNLILARYLKPVEHAIYALEERGVRVFAKGRNLQQRAMDIISAYGLISDCVVVEADHSKFDSCVRVEHLRECHRLYMHYFKSRQLYKALQAQLHNRGSTDYLKYTVRGTRMSGDFDTALGNSLINYAVLNSVMLDQNIKNFHLYIDGDDSLIFMSRKDSEKMGSMDFGKYGFETKWAVKDLISAEFCQMHVIRSDPPILARHPQKIFSNLQVCLRSYAKTIWPSLWQGKLKCEIMCNQGVPYVASYLEKYLDGKIVPKIPYEDERRLDMTRGMVEGRCTSQAHADYYDAFDVGCDDPLFTPDALVVPENIGIRQRHHLQRLASGRRKLVHTTKYVWSDSSISRIETAVPRVGHTSSGVCGKSCGYCCEQFNQPCGQCIWQLPQRPASPSSGTRV